MDEEALDRLAEEYLTLSEYLEKLTTDLESIKATLRQLGPGDHPTRSGLLIKVTPPARRFNPYRALSLVDPDQQASCMISRPDPDLVKRSLTQAEIEECMEPGTGKEGVKVK